jgi:hypothetical protein
MGKILHLLGHAILGSALVLAMAVVYSTAKGRATWYFRVNGSVTVDGCPTGGYMHANTGRTVLLITRTDGTRPETYLVTLAAGGPILDCGAWHPIRFLPNVVGDLSSRCLAMKVKPAGRSDSPAGTTLVRAGRSIEFTTTSSRKVKAEW